MAAEAAITSLVGMLGNLVIQKVKFLQGVEGKVHLLEDELRRMQSFLKDANKKQAGDKRVRNWISEIRDVAQDAQDTIEMFLLNVENPRKTSLLKRCTGFSKRMYHLDRIGEEIESILTKLEAIDASRERYNIKDLGEVSAGSSSQVESLRRLAPSQKDKNLVGFEDDVEKLLEASILNEEEKKGVSVAVVVGMGGSGKSSLAREIYNHAKVVNGRFDCRGWVVVSSVFTPLETTKQLILELEGADHKTLRQLEETTGGDDLYLRRKLEEMLRNHLQGKSYFIVLDDVWQREHFESLAVAFPNQKDKASRLLVTSRNKIVTEYDQYVHNMNSLGTEKSWELLLKKANIFGRCPEELESIGRQISEKCHGLPLAISVVGGVLMETRTKSGWKEVLNQINSYLGRAESNVSRYLELSYQNLSPQLKSCFLCLAFFKEDFTIPAQRLVNIWVGRGLIQNQREDSRTADEIGRGYLNELINRSMVQIKDLIMDDRVENCCLHDLLHDLCLRKANEEIGLRVVMRGEEEGVSSDESSYKTRHRVVYGKGAEVFSLGNQNKHLRSLFLLNVSIRDVRVISDPFRDWKKSFQLLETLDLDGFGFRELPDSFRLLHGLKYLRIFRKLRYPFVRYELKLPSWLDRLKKLEVLSLKHDSVVFPRVALKMERLRHFEAHDVKGRLVNIGSWKSIETLNGIRIHDLLCYSESLHEMGICQHLRELGMVIYEVEGNKLREARDLLEKTATNLVELHLETYMSSVEEIIPRQESITVLDLSCSVTLLRCPAADVYPPNLSRLTLNYLPDYPMQELGKLPNLLYLTIVGVRKYHVWRMKVLHDGFPCLRLFSIHYLHSLRGIDIEHGGMPRLQQLEIHHCLNLKTHNLPKYIIITYITRTRTPLTEYIISSTFRS